jgi:hypothetical protein
MHRAQYSREAELHGGDMLAMGAELLLAVVRRRARSARTALKRSAVTGQLPSCRGTHDTSRQCMPVATSCSAAALRRCLSDALLDLGADPN